ncbi:glucose/arabinose dehydrogenase [Pontibacter ummariensis]|uniref:Glucose/arabinose dehydrogenase, beta-propeller fold n=1 Tax=Pontibacter ummariensis TaxID=1610492 RepID=A0A239HDX2_9BACT|nr:PQQ-dependent sugar dehydrogenase [Pontibacter ummariensis]PRY10675.1 glucose/arabinose dehydrogenase [Pontibacter ummariensis]SNS78454.1 Glucose/arabinose dehydrogenase, beta-propeller fold [Pontibacter ummariensis]
MKSLHYLLPLLLAVSLSGCFRLLSSDGGGQGRIRMDVRPVDPEAIALPAGYQAEVVATGLTFPTGAAFDAQGRLYVIESGYSYGEIFFEPRLLRVEPDGSLTTIATGVKNGPWTGITYYKGNFYVAEGGELLGGRILRISPDGNITSLVEDLPTMGDHHTNGPVISADGQLYFSLGTATNSGVVGPDNYDYGWLKRYPDFHDIPCEDIVLVGRNYVSDLPPEPESAEHVTGAYSPYGTATTEGQVIEGRIPCSGAVMRIPVNGGAAPELVAWGFRNPFSLAFSPAGRLYVTENAYDVRGSRPVWGVADNLWEVQQGKWYGWPDYAGGELIDGERYEAPNKKVPNPILARHPSKPPKPVAKLGVHSSSNGLDFSRSDAFGYKGEAFIAQYGDLAPGVGKVLAPVGFKVIRVNVETGVVTEFAANKGKMVAPASKLMTGGLERPISVKFSPDGESLYIVDFGIMETGEEDLNPEVETGVIWKITKTEPGL